MSAAPRQTERLVRQGFTAWQEARYAHALDAFDAAVREAPANPAGWSGRGHALWSMAQFAAALESFAEAARLEPDHAAHWSNVGLCCRDLGRPRDAVNAFQTALRLTPTYAPAYNEWANVLVDLGRYEEALPLYDEALRLDGTRAVVHHNRGVCLERMGHPDQALRAFQQALERDPDYTHSLEELGILYLERAEPERAVPLLRRASTPRAAALLASLPAAAAGEGAEGPGALFVRPRFLDAAECDDLRAAVDAAAREHAPVLDARGRSVLDNRSRSARYAMLPPSLIHTMHRRMEGVLPDLERHFGVALRGCESPQFLVYGEGDFFTPHRDRAAPGSGEGADRLISAVIFLSNPAAEPRAGHYGGGSLTLYLSGDGREDDGRTAITAPAGLLVAFPSDLLHEVTPIAHGRRYTVVSWFS